MSKYIPSNQKHLSFKNLIYLENELNKGASFKDIAHFLCKDPTTISKEVMAHRLSAWYHKGTFYNAKNFCVHRYHAKEKMSVAISVPPVLPATRPAGILKRNAAIVWIKFLMSATDAQRKSTAVRLHISIPTMPALLIVNTQKYFVIPEPVST